MKKVLIITGPTATGKTSLAIDIAKQNKGALISVDSIQVYKNCDIISGKDIPSGANFEKIKVSQIAPQFEIGRWKIENIPLYLTNVVGPTYNFSVSDFLKLTNEILDIVEARGEYPIFVGGSTLYIQSLLKPIETVHIPPDVLLRGRLTNATVEELQAILAKADKKKLASMNESDINNPRRLIRAIEVANATKDTFVRTEVKDYDFLPIGLKLDREMLKEKIDKRVVSRLDEGAIDEAKKLFENYEKLSPNIKTANGYRQLFEYVKGEVTQEEAIVKWKQSEYLHAKNQMTYLRKLPGIHWFDVASKKFPRNAISYTKNKV